MTIPGNQAVAYGEKIVYVLIDIELSNLDTLENKRLIISKSLLKEVTNFCNINKFKIIKEIKGSLLQGTIAFHPFKKGYKHQIPLLKGDFVEESEGTGFVHVAPSYGEDDFNLAKLHGIKIHDIIHDNGVYKENTPLFAGVHVFKADVSVIESLKEENNLIGEREYRHSYPHSWRSKKPVI